MPTIDREHLPITILIGGTSHCGKSTLAKALSTLLGAVCISTDSLARHPGRPWKERPELIPDHVRTHYAQRPVSELMASVLAHYHRLWPTVVAVIETHRQASHSLVLEGSGLLPAQMHTLPHQHLHALWLYASEPFLVDRIRRSSRYAEKLPAAQHLIDQFTQRSLAFNGMILQQGQALNLPLLNVEHYADVNTLVQACLTITGLEDLI